MKLLKAQTSYILDLDDGQLWIELKKNNPEALKILFHRYYNDLYFYGTRLINDNNLIIDTIQDVFEILWENKNRLSDVKHVRAYVFRIFRNKLLKVSRHNLRLFSLKDINDIPEVEFVIPQEEIITARETRAQISKSIIAIIEKLTDKQKEILYLKFFCNLSNSDISKTLSINKQSVSNLLNRSINSIRRKLI